MFQSGGGKDLITISHAHHVALHVICTKLCSRSLLCPFNITNNHFISSRCRLPCVTENEWLPVALSRLISASVYVMLEVIIELEKHKM